jgi:hypothetical protein
MTAQSQEEETGTHYSKHKVTLTLSHLQEKLDSDHKLTDIFQNVSDLLNKNYCYI